MCYVLLSFIITVAPALAQERRGAPNHRPVIVEKRVPAEEKTSPDTEKDVDPVAIVVIPFRMLRSILPQLDNK